MLLGFEGQISPDIYLRALKVHGGPSRLVAILALVMVPVMIYGVIIVPLMAGQAITGVFPLLLWVAVAVLMWLGPKFAVHRMLRTNKVLAAPIRGSVMNTGVHLSTPYSESDLPWKVFIKSKMTNDMVLLYQSNHQFQIFAKEWFPSVEGWEAFKTQVLSSTTHEKRRLMPFSVRIVLIGVGVLLVLLLIYEFLKPANDHPKGPAEEGASSHAMLKAGRYWRDRRL
jgi:hypothetical protein